MTETETPRLWKLAFNPRNQATRGYMAAPLLMHGLICRLAGCSRSDGGLLWRWEPPDSRQPTALLQSTVDLEGDVKPPPYLTIEGPRRLSAHLDRLQTGAAVRYRVSVSPIRRSKSRDMLVPTDEWGQWWIDKASKRGLEVASAAFNQQPRRRHPKSKIASLHCLHIDGYGTVTDPETLRQAIIGGVGRAKAYGCGLMTVRHL